MTEPFDNPVVQLAWRGEEIEFQRRAAVCVVRDGDVVYAVGDTSYGAFMRSSAKFFQAVPNVLSGATDRFALGDREIALMCASHGGEPEHVEVARGLLAKGSLDVSNLMCGTHAPLHRPSAHALAAAGVEPTALHNNCSGKHSGMMLTALAYKVTIEDYIDPTHAVQREIADVLLNFAEADADDLRTMIDGCSAPTFRLPLENAARAFANFGHPARHVPGVAKRAAERIRHAVAAEPSMIAGHGRLCSAIVAATEGRVIAKIGADGFYGAFSTADGTGVAIHLDDGDWNGSERVLLSVLDKVDMVTADEMTALRKWWEPTRRNHAGFDVGCFECLLPDMAS